jgi:hypothetical protein
MNYAVYEDSQKAFDRMTAPANGYQKWVRPPNDMNEGNEDDDQVVSYGKSSEDTTYNHSF